MFLKSVGRIFICGIRHFNPKNAFKEKILRGCVKKNLYLLTGLALLHHLQHNKGMKAAEKDKVISSMLRDEYSR
ncbi:MAG: hypothetical protein CVV37_03570 [Nitrospira bacterium HGW-Nitrospira-1]|nr:MAG: hypothetical protein CVV37_03570 [Nitrospira bacterium HGW-Nitrospira-1]